jgi:uncharacterized protein Smg (DUF494 family)
MLEQLMPFDESIMEDELPSEERSSLVAFLRHWQEDQTFLEVFERLWNRLLDPEVSPDHLEADHPIRVFTEEEERLLTTEARGYILKVQAVGVLTTSQIEKVVDRAFECWTEEISLDQVRFLVAAVLLYEVFGADDIDVNFAQPPTVGLD